MNAVSLYVSTSRIVFQNDGATDENLSDLCRLVPYLRQSLSCAVCGHLLVEPYTPIHCQHHVCKQCVRGRKNLKPTCVFCKDFDKYEENVQLRILLQCYRSLCKHIMTTPIYSAIQRQMQGSSYDGNCGSKSNTSLGDFIEEGAKFEDNFKCNSGLKRSEISILPCVFPLPPQPPPLPKTVVNEFGMKIPKRNHVLEMKPMETKLSNVPQLPPIKTVSNGSAMYSVLYTGIGNKITIKRKTDNDEDCETNKFPTTVIRTKTATKRRGCRCGNATATPGKLTCCGQRCPCYVESKSCIDCKCRGCRNPHRPDGGKVRPHIPELACYEIQVAEESTNFTTGPSLATNIDNRLKVPLQDFNTVKRMPTAASVVITTPQPAHGQITNNQIRQPSSVENMKSESLLISSSERGFQVLNVFSPSHRQQCSSGSRLHTGQLTNITTTLPQILMQQQDTSNIFVQSNDLQSHQPLFLSPNSSSTFTLSPIIVTSSSGFPCQVFSEEEITTTTQCSLPSSSHPPPLVDLVVSGSEPIISDSASLLH